MEYCSDVHANIPQRDDLTLYDAERGPYSHRVTGQSAGLAPVREMKGNYRCVTEELSLPGECSGSEKTNEVA